MKIEDIVVNTTGEKRDRNKSIFIDCNLELSPDFILSCQREVIVIDSNGKRIYTNGVYGEHDYTISKRLSEISNRTITLPVEAGGVTLTVGQIALAIEMLTDDLAVENS